ncbi:MAG: hypothetical protein R3F24_12495 [Gammaproteobacteria bacterium]
MDSEYATRGRIGVGTPQANPTVEAEFRRLVPIDLALVTVRLHSASSNPPDRLMEYLQRLPVYLATLGGMPLDAFCYACTGSSYLLGHDTERRLVSAAEQRYGFPILTATEAIARRLHRLNARRVVLMAPYPPWLLAAATTFWEARGIQLVAGREIRIRDADDLTSIYALNSSDALAAIRELGAVDADAVLLSGTGMPTLPIIDEAQTVSGVPVLSSNLALVDEVLAMLV